MGDNGARPLPDNSTDAKAAVAEDESISDGAGEPEAVPVGGEEAAAAAETRAGGKLEEGEDESGRRKQDDDWI